MAVVITCDSHKLNVSLIIYLLIPFWGLSVALLPNYLLSDIDCFCFDFGVIVNHFSEESQVHQHMFIHTRPAIIKNRNEFRL